MARNYFKAGRDDGDVKRIMVFSSMNALISSHWRGWELVANIRGEKGTDIGSFAVLHEGRLVRADPNPPMDGALLIRSIADAFATAYLEAEDGD